jgi:hypothetical protein
VVELVRGHELTLGDLFAVWGRRLGPRAFLGFPLRSGERVRAYVNGSAWAGDPRALPLRRHDEIVLELGRYIPPHESYRFPKGL